MVLWKGLAHLELKDLITILNPFLKQYLSMVYPDFCWRKNTIFEGHTSIFFRGFNLDVASFRWYPPNSW